MTYNIQIHKSPRGMPLMWMLAPGVKPTLTVENYLKWYELFLLHPNGEIESVPFSKLDDPAFCYSDESAYCDHVPNPAAVYRYAEANDYHLDDQAFEMIVGRWELEYHENYHIEKEDEDRVREQLEDAVFVQEEDDPEVCVQCEGPAYVLGKLGKNTHYRCRNCGSDQYKEPDEPEEWQCLDPECPEAKEHPYHSHPGPQRVGKEPH